MILAKVEYEFFEWEEPSPESLELRRQAHLSFADGTSAYVSWTAERSHGPEDEPYSISYSPGSFFSGSAASVVDASRSRAWSRLIGQDVILTYRDSAFQELEVRAGQHATVLGSFKYDLVGITTDPPSQVGLSKAQCRLTMD